MDDGRSWRSRWCTHHQASHTNGDLYADGVTYTMARIADLMITLRDTELVNGTNLLDSAIVYGTSDCAVGWTHGIARQPLVLVGRRGVCA